jgi:hypothetical protein
MNRHLSESELVDLAEGALDSRRATHVETCAACREQGEALSAMLRATASIEVPDPSPLFWEHFPARVRGAIAAEPAAGRPAWAWLGMRGLVPFAAAAAVVIAVFSGVYLMRGARVGPMAPRTAAGSALVAGPASDGQIDGLPDPDNEEVWDVLTAAASTVELGDAHDVGMHVHPAAIEHAVQGLSAAERTELGRLLQSELKRSSN